MTDEPRITTRDEFPPSELLLGTEFNGADAITEEGATRMVFLTMVGGAHPPDNECNGIHRTIFEMTLVAARQFADSFNRDLTALETM